MLLKVIASRSTEPLSHPNVITLLKIEALLLLKVISLRTWCCDNVYSGRQKNHPRQKKRPTFHSNFSVQYWGFPNSCLNYDLFYDICFTDFCKKISQKINTDLWYIWCAKVTFYYKNFFTEPLIKWKENFLYKCP